MKKISILTAFMLFSTLGLSAQDNGLRLGVRLGGGISKTREIGKVLVPEDFYSNYEFSDKFQIVPNGGVFIQYHKSGSIFGVEAGMNFYQKASKLTYSDNMELNYDVTTRYSHIGIDAMLKCYPWRKGFNISIGGRVSSILNPKGLDYSSNQEDSRFAIYEYATVSETERIMRDKLTGRPDVAVGGGLGYEIGSHWAVNAMYFYGVTSTIKTESNTFNWVNRDNHSHNIEINVSYLFNL